MARGLGMGVTQIWSLGRTVSTEFLKVWSRFDLYQYPLGYLLKMQALEPHLIIVSECWGVGEDQEAPFLINLGGKSYVHLGRNSKLRNSEGNFCLFTIFQMKAVILALRLWH